ncbi:MAG: hypothetical protein A2W08_05595 [Candidatus Rokubacteria bacterium RBG_16_73_20]|nr:MAG: hypothetical protein A2050_05580 [Candidatus Rokubacteria bacterium GWA2_73_35]OGK91648.1 MAG: hypothetical protein A2W08_05595 [Candidatus Rokubacteria bacterium RBG_16_73_20]HAM58050.1 hypothetical protein [Candidatus Rokubacteria bacterium]HBH02609.1 hypothetical protein [Candidatus Rokubacteria bacterium]
MTTLLVILAVAVLFALFGLVTRGRRLACGRDGSCPVGSAGCDACELRPQPPVEPPVESDHAQR